MQDHLGRSFHHDLDRVRDVRDLGIARGAGDPELNFGTRLLVPLR
jgi:hypothetical protein